jgi:DNA-binding response OmpR family regulator
MFRWADVFRFWPRQQVTGAAAETQSVRLLVITSSDRFYAGLLQVASSSGWEVRRAGTVQEGLRMVRSLAMPLILYDWDEQGDDWRDAVNHLGAAPNHPCVLLASRFADDNLRQEVLRFHGYDVLARSAEPDQVVRTIEFAWFWITRSQRFADCRRQQEAQN